MSHLGWVIKVQLSTSQLLQLTCQLVNLKIKSSRLWLPSRSFTLVTAMANSFSFSLNMSLMESRSLVRLPLLLALAMSGCPRSCRSFRSFCSWLSTLSLSLVRIKLLEISLNLCSETKKCFSCLRVQNYIIMFQLHTLILADQTFDKMMVVA